MKFIIFNTALFIASAGLSYQLKDTPKSNQSIACISKAKSFVKDKKQPLKNLDELQPCSATTIEVFLSDNKHFSKEILDEVSLQAAAIKKYLKWKPETEEEMKQHLYLLEKLKENGLFFRKMYPRFALEEGLPNDYLNYGIHTGNYDDPSQFLGKRICSNPQLTIANDETSYLSLFFSVNQGRSFGGIIRIINERIVTLVEGRLLIDGNDEYFETKVIPQASFKSWVHEDLQREYKDFVYQEHAIAQLKEDWDSNYFVSPWLYNSCNKSISTVNNNCSLDPSFDMELKDFYYLTQYDVLLGNIFCKKSSDKSWTRIATLEFIRI